MKQHRHIFMLAACAALLAACSTPRAGRSNEGVGLEQGQASIAFANQRNAVTSWQADGREGLWIQDGRKDWYYAKLFGPCEGLERAIRIAFDTGSSDKLDRFSYVLVPGAPARCAISSFTRSEEPPEGRRRTLEGEAAK
jgi:hypothetical protein